MNSTFTLLFTVSLAACAAAPPPVASAVPPSAAAAVVSAPPLAKRVPHIERLHGADRVDDYYWLRQKDTPEVLAYLHAENAYTDAVMQPARRLQESLYREMRSRLKETDLSVPFRKSG